MDAKPATTPTGDPSQRTERRESLFTQARAATGFMPDEEGEALYRPPTGRRLL